MVNYIKGQRVRVLRSYTGPNTYKAGEEYTVVEDLGEVVRVKGDAIHKSNLELISEPHYTKINPKVGEKYRVVKKPKYSLSLRYMMPGQTFQVELIDKSAIPVMDKNRNWYDESWLTTEFLELITEPEPNCMFMGKPLFITDEAVKELSHGSIVRMGVDFGYAEPINKPKKLTLMQTLTKELKKLLSPRLQKFYKTEIIDRGLELTSTGRTAYINALFANNGDHEKALVEMEADADERIKAEEKE